MQKAVIGDATRFYAGGLALGKHGVQRSFIDFECDVQIKIMLLLKVLF